MAWRIYRSTDSSAPVLTGQAGSAITLLDAVLVNGYGSKAAAGWSKAYSGTNKAAYRSAATASARHYIRVDDAAALGPGTREALVRGYMAMTDVDTGTDPFPTVAQAANGMSLGKSTTTDATARPWVIAADERTFIVLVLVGRWQLHYFGEIQSFKPGDAYHATIIGPTGGSTPDGFSANPFAYLGFPSDAASTYGTLPGHLIARAHGQSGSAVNCTKIAASNMAHAYALNTDGFSNDGWGSLPRVNPADGGVYLVDFLVCEPTWVIRGRVRGLYAMAHRGSLWANGETFAGLGAFAGKSFEVFKLSPYQTFVGTPYEVDNLTALEISDTAY